MEGQSDLPGSVAEGQELGCEVGPSDAPGTFWAGSDSVLQGFRG
jgi:hypothetical protein